MAIVVDVGKHTTRLADSPTQVGADMHCPDMSGGRRPPACRLYGIPGGVVPYTTIKGLSDIYNLPLKRYFRLVILI